MGNRSRTHRKEGLMRKWGALVLLGVLAFIPVKGWAAEEAPFFVGEIFYPNALIIFDNSDSMQDVPYLNPGAIAVRPGHQWRQDVMDQGGTAFRNTAGNLVWTVRTDRDCTPTFITAGTGTTVWNTCFRRASGGNHPASKLYQAKQALNRVLADLQNVNLGFGTYLTIRAPRVVAKYYRVAPATTYYTVATTPTRWQFLARRSVTDSRSLTQYNPTMFTWGGLTHGGVGTSWTQLVTDNDPQPTTCASCRTMSRTYTITSLTTLYGGDGQVSGYRWNFSAPNTWDYGYQIINDADYDPTCTASGVWNTCNPAGLPTQVGSWIRIQTGAGCNLWRKLPYSVTTTYSVVPEMYLFNWFETYGSWIGPATGAARYIDPSTFEVTPVTVLTSGGYTWQLVTTTLANVVINTAGSHATVEPGRYKSDFYYYPGMGTPDRPHAWSYVHRGVTTGNLLGTWSDDIQPTPFFPASVGDEDANVQGDDQVIFVNLPEAGTNDAAMANRDKILQWVTLERYQGHARYGQMVNILNAPDTGANYDFTMAPFTRSLSPSTYAMAYWDLNANATRDAGDTGKATPLAATLRYAKKYYQSYIEQDTETQAGCRDNYVILLTDGLDTCDCNPGDPGYLSCTAPVDAATELRNIVVGDETFEVKTYVIGFGLEAAQKANLDAIAAAGGTTEAYLATNVEELTTALNRIFQAIQTGKYSRSDLAIARDGSTVYAAYFSYPGWAGRFKAFHVVTAEDHGNGLYLDKPVGAIAEEISAWGGSNCPDWITNAVIPDSCAGDAGGSMNDPSLQPTRTLYTTVGTGINPGRIKMSFNVTTDGITYLEGTLASLKPYLNPSGEDIDGDGNFNEDEDAEKVLQFILNPGYDDNTADENPAPYKGTRYPDWRLGDLYHTTPVVVGPPPFLVSWGSYPEYKALHASRPTVVYVGSNGGMLHAINDSNGTERWAYAPKMVLANLKTLKSEHAFFVDSKPTIADVYSSGGGGTVWPDSVPPGNPELGWHTVLISGMRDGGRGYFALDVTDPDDPKVLWEWTDDNGANNMGYTWSVPAIGRVKVGTQDKWVAFVGGGWWDDADMPGNLDIGNRLYIIDIEKGELLIQGSNIAEYVIGVDKAGESNWIARNRVASGVREVDIDKNGYVERIYFGDTHGVMWKMDLTSTDMGDWVPCVLLDPATYDFSGLSNPPSVDPNSVAPRPIFYPPAVGRGDSGNYFVFFGTGNERTPNQTDTQDFFYEVEDNGTRSGSVCTGQVNWVKVLPDAGEKVLARPSIFNYVVYFTTYVPPPPESECGAGSGRLYGLTMSRGVDSTGGGEAGIMFDPSGAALETPVEYRELGAGVPTAPIVTNGTIYVTTSNTIGEIGSGGIITQSINPVGGQIRGWREVF